MVYNYQVWSLTALLFVLAQGVWLLCTENQEVPTDAEKLSS